MGRMVGLVVAIAMMLAYGSAEKKAINHGADMLGTAYERALDGDASGFDRFLKMFGGSEKVTIDTAGWVSSALD